ncbi:unnamed protein product [Linum trigynum]|uniref:Uncharacterized protein n=1 Tax=Linum trigynum TaxID=586398 RepID=A0AAV2EB46_9ROSI
MGTGTAAERSSALEATVEELQGLVQANAADLEELKEQVKDMGEVLKTLVAKIDALTQQREGKGVMTPSFSGDKIRGKETVCAGASPLCEALILRFGN